MSKKENERHLLSRAIASGIDTPEELANFMGQMQVESAGFATLSENLNYSADRLLKVFPGRNGLRTKSEAELVSAGGVETIAEKVYGGAWGHKNLGNTEPGDAWRFRGRGFVQLTGRARYAEVAAYTGIDLVGHPELAQDPDIAATIAIEYWKREVVSRGHQADVVAATHDINKGSNGLKERRSAAAEWRAKFEHDSPQEVLAALSRSPDSATKHLDSSPAAHQRPQMSRHDVSELQSLLNELGYHGSRGRQLIVDGVFGAQTVDAVRAFQQAHGLPPVGHVGPKTQTVLEYARTHGPTPVDPAHPDHALQQQVSRAVDAMERARGRVPDGHSERLKGSLLVAAREQGLTRVDHVVLSEARGGVRAGQNAFAVQGRLDDPASRRVHVGTQQALATPVDASWTRLAQVEARQRDAPPMAHALAAGHDEHGAGWRRVPAP